MESNETQCRLILAHLQSGKTITPLDALQMFGCFRLSARIWDLRHKQKYDIVTFKDEFWTSDGNKKYVARYALKGGPKSDE